MNCLIVLERAAVLEQVSVAVVSAATSTRRQTQRIHNITVSTKISKSYRLETIKRNYKLFVPKLVSVVIPTLPLYTNKTMSVNTPAKYETSKKRLKPADGIEDSIDVNNTDNTNNSTIIIDGSKGEGGGQILRNAITYATIFHNKELIINNIRGKRSKPGLQAQHMTGLQLAVNILGGGILSGNQIQSSEIHYIPPKPFSNDNLSASSKINNSNNNNNRTTNGNNTITSSSQSFVGDTGTAGSICLLLQVALPCALFANCQITVLDLKGGTNASMAPQYDYWEYIFWPTICKHCRINPDIIQTHVWKRGFYPKGGGHVRIIVDHQQSDDNNKNNGDPFILLQPIQLTDRGEVYKLHIRSYHAGNLPRQLAQEMADCAKKYFKQKCKTIQTITIDVVSEKNSIGSSLGILLIAETTTGCLLGGSSLSSPRDKNKKAYNIAIEACDELYTTIQDGGCVDEWLQDQLILFMALACGKSNIITGSLTLHTQTAIWIAELMSGAKFTVTKLVEEEDAKSKVIIESGIGKGANNNADGACYGKDGRIDGRHLIQCEGIGYRRITR